MSKQIALSLGLVVLLSLAAAGTVGCGGSSETSASPGDSDASENKQEGSGKDDERAKEGVGSEDDGEQADGDEKAEAGDDEAEKEEKKEEAVPVDVVELDRGEIESILRYSANLEAESQVKVFSEAKRLVTELLVEEGDVVQQGTVLLRLQDDEQKSALAKVQSQLAKAEREYAQQERLYEQKLISEQAFRDATYEVEQLRIALADAERELGYTEVRAPIGGTITGRLVNLGDQVQIGQHLFDMVDFDSIVARIFVPEKHLRRLSAGLPARIMAQAAGEDVYHAAVKRVSPVVDPRSGTVKVTVGIGGQPGLRPGMYVDVDLVTATHSEAVRIPKRALVYDDDQVFVYRLKPDERRVQRIFFEPYLSDKDWVEPREGLAAGDMIVVAGQAGLKDGALVSLPGDPDEDESSDEDEEDSTVAQASR